MPQAQLHSVRDFLRKVSTANASTEPTDSDLLEAFLSHRDAAAFESLMIRHGPLVLEVCRSILSNETEAEDASQATFLVFAKNARTIQKRASLASWLYGVALRTSRKLLTRNVHRKRQEALVSVPNELPEPDLTWQEARQIVHEEVGGMGDPYRSALVLCYLQGKTHEEAARILHVSTSGLKKWLERGRASLRLRLIRRGLGPTALTVLAGWPFAQASAESIHAIARRTVSAWLASPSSTASATLAHHLASRIHQEMIFRKLMFVSLWVTLSSAMVFLAIQSTHFVAANHSMPETVESVEAEEAEAGEVAERPKSLPASAITQLGSNRLRTGGNVRSLAFSPDRKRLACVVDENTDGGRHIVVFDTETGVPTRKIEVASPVRALQWVSNEQALAAMENFSIFEFTRDPTPNQVPGGGSGKHRFSTLGPGAAISPDGKVLAISAVDGDTGKPCVGLFALKPGESLADLVLVGKREMPFETESILLSPNGKLLLAYSKRTPSPENPKLHLQEAVTVDFATGKTLARFPVKIAASNGNRTACAVSNTWLAHGLENGDTALWNLTNGKERLLKTLHSHDGDPKKPYGTYAVAFSADGRVLATGGRDQRIRSWDVESGKLIVATPNANTWVEAIGCSEDGKRIAAGGQGALVRIWNGETGQDACPVEGHTAGIWNASLSSDSKLAFTGGSDHTVVWWDTSTGKEIRRTPNPGYTAGVQVSPDGATVLAADSEGNLRRWAVATGNELPAPKFDKRISFGQLIFSPDGKTLITGKDDSITIMTWPDLKVVHAFELPKPANSPGKNQCDALTVSHDHRWLVTVAHRSWSRLERGLNLGYASDGVVDLWELSTGKYVRRVVEGGVFRTASFTADGRLVVAGASGAMSAEKGGSGEKFNTNLTLVDPIACRWIRGFENPTVTGRKGHIYSGATQLSPDGRLLVVGYNTGHVVVFEVATGKVRRILPRSHESFVSALAFAEKEGRMVSAGIDSLAFVWDMGLAGAAAALPASELDDRTVTVEKLWEQVQGADAEVAGKALAKLFLRKNKSVAFLRTQFQPAAKSVSPQVIADIFKDLDSEDFKTRDQATKALSQLGEAAVATVRKQLETNVSIEVRQRVRRFLDQHEQSEQSPNRIRLLRALELLESIRTPEAIVLLRHLASGDAEAWATQETRLTLQRATREAN